MENSNVMIDENALQEAIKAWLTHTVYNKTDLSQEAWDEWLKTPTFLFFNRGMREAIAAYEAAKSSAQPDELPQTDCFGAPLSETIKWFEIHQKAHHLFGSKPAHIMNILEAVASMSKWEIGALAVFDAARKLIEEWDNAAFMEELGSDSFIALRDALTQIEVGSK